VPEPLDNKVEPKDQPPTFPPVAVILLKLTAALFDPAVILDTANEPIFALAICNTPFVIEHPPIVPSVAVIFPEIVALFAVSAPAVVT
jgi:hypothetical protein